MKERGGKQSQLFFEELGSAELCSSESITLTREGRCQQCWGPARVTPVVQKGHLRQDLLLRRPSETTGNCCVLCYRHSQQVLWPNKDFNDNRQEAALLLKPFIERISIPWAPYLWLTWDYSSVKTGHRCHWYNLSTGPRKFSAGHRNSNSRQPSAIWRCFQAYSILYH